MLLIYCKHTLLKFSGMVGTGNKSNMDNSNFGLNSEQKKVCKHNKESVNLLKLYCVPCQEKIINRSEFTAIFSVRDRREG